MSRARRISTEKIFYTGKQERDRTLTELRKKVKANSEMPDVDVKRTYQDLKDSAAHSKVGLLNGGIQRFKTVRTFFRTESPNHLKLAGS